MIKRILVFFVTLLLCNALTAQQFEVPQNVVLQSPKDFAHYEVGVVQAYDWLLKTPVNQETEKRKQVNAFLLKWMEGSPNVTLQIQPEIVTFLDCPDCLMIFMGGWTIHDINNSNSNDAVKGATAGIEGVIDLYNRNKEILGKNKAIEKYIKLQEKGKLEKYVSEHMK